jgi:hypothetical protein
VWFIYEDTAWTVPGRIVVEQKERLSYSLAKRPLSARLGHMTFLLCLLLGPDLRAA